MNFTRKIGIYSFALTLLSAASLKSFAGEVIFKKELNEASESRPNVLVVVVDDLGYTDIGAFGGEIKTPNLDMLATEGVRLDSFYASPTCSPTRSMLLTGTDSHLTGFGNMTEAMAPNQRGKKGYEGYLPSSVLTLPQLMKDAGYRTFMAGKWHLGMEKKHSPYAKGFDDTFALLYGGASHFTMRGPESYRPVARYRSNGEEIDALPKNFYSTDFYTDKIIEFIDKGTESRSPFFGYLSYTALHWPLQAPQEYIDKYKGVYDQGWDKLRKERFNKAKQLGLIPENAKFPARNPKVPSWDSLLPSDKEVESRKMEIYSAMLDNLDYNMGRLIKHLKSIGEFENTFILVMSDNGAEGVSLGGPVFTPWIEQSDNSYENMGREKSFVFTGPGWAQASSAPFDYFKTFTSEGGIRVPAMIHYPAFVRSGSSSGKFSSVLDIVPTVLELAGIDHPGKSYRGKTIEPLRGESMINMLSGKSSAVHDEEYYMGWELFGRRAIRQGHWKLRWIEKPNASGEWELFDLSKDHGEQFNLAAKEPEKLQSLIRLWNRYVEETGLVLPEGVVGY